MNRLRFPRLTHSSVNALGARLRSGVRPLDRLPPTVRFLLAAAAFTVIITLLLAQAEPYTSIADYKEGDVVRRTVVAPSDITSRPAGDSEDRRTMMMAAVPPVFRFDPRQAESSTQGFRVLLESMAREIPSPDEDPSLPLNNEDGKVNTSSSPAALRRLTPPDIAVLTDMLREASGARGYIYDDAEGAHLAAQITVVDVRTNAQSDLSVSPEQFRPLSEARETLRAAINRLAGWTEDEQTVLAALMVPRLMPNIFFDRAATETTRSRGAASATGSVSLKRNQVVAREGDTVTGQMLTHFAAIRSHAHTAERRWPHLIGLFLIVAALFWIIWKFAEHRSVATSLSLPKHTTFMLVGSAVVVQTILMRLGFVVADSIATQNLSSPLDDPALWSFAIPFAAAALLVAMLVDSQLGMITGLVTALFAGLLAPNGVVMAFYSLVSSSAAIYGIRRYSERQSVTLAGLFAGAVNALMSVAVVLFAHQSITFNTVLFAIACGVAGGLLTIIFTSGGLPINESFFGILTDVKLLELSNADLPALGQLALRAPGTNQHSHAVSQLAEDACRAVKANSLLARVGALYHDIGKVAAPEMFIENQHGDNPHDRQRPSNSARIITSHVTYGLKLAKEIGLPKPISDFIAQHHGTRTLHCFLRKAEEEARPGEVIDQAAFRYPGPKPQFKEAAIMMLADSCEAAARSLAHPDADNIHEIVARIFEAVLSDDQLDECDLTLRELKIIRESITTSLTAIYHARVDYPGFNPPALTDTYPPMSPQLPAAAATTTTNGRQRNARYTTPSEVPISRGGEVEDEAVTRKARSGG